MLSDPVKYQAVRFTHGFGVLPVHSTSTYCVVRITSHRTYTTNTNPDCHRRYHHNYVVHKDSDPEYVLVV